MTPIYDSHFQWAWYDYDSPLWLPYPRMGVLVTGCPKKNPYDSHPPKLVPKHITERWSEAGVTFVTQFFFCRLSLAWVLLLGGEQRLEMKQMFNIQEPRLQLFFKRMGWTYKLASWLNFISRTMLVFVYPSLISVFPSPVQHRGAAHLSPQHLCHRIRSNKRRYGDLHRCPGPRIHPQSFWWVSAQTQTGGKISLFWHFPETTEITSNTMKAQQC